jgi:hypothetical protein
MPRLTAPAALLACLWAGAAAPASLPAAAAAVTTMGASDCGHWRNAQEEVRLGMQLWLLGVLSGVNISGITEADLLKEASARQLIGWMDSYCATHPLDSTLAGVKALVVELLEKTPASRR